MRNLQNSKFVAPAKAGVQKALLDSGFAGIDGPNCVSPLSLRGAQSASGGWQSRWLSGGSFGKGIATLRSQ